MVALLPVWWLALVPVQRLPGAEVPMPVNYATIGGQGEGRQLWPDGEPIVVLRPLNKPQSMALVSVAIKHDSFEALKEAVTSGPCELLGFLTMKDGKLVAVDENDENPVAIEQGDVMAAPSDLRRAD